MITGEDPVAPNADPASDCPRKSIRHRRRCCDPTIRSSLCAPETIPTTLTPVSYTHLDVYKRQEYIPAHRYVGIWDKEVQDYMSFWGRHDCDKVCGFIDSMSHVSHPVVTCHTAGWFYENGRRGYFYGLGVPLDFDGGIPEGFEIRTVPESYYLVFGHPPFDFLKDCAEVMKRVESLAWHFDPSSKGYAWNEERCV